MSASNLPTHGGELQRFNRRAMTAKLQMAVLRNETRFLGYLLPLSFL